MFELLAVTFSVVGAPFCRSCLEVTSPITRVQARVTHGFHAFQLVLEALGEEAPLPRCKRWCAATNIEFH